MTIFINIDETTTHEIDRGQLETAIQFTLHSQNRLDVDITLQLTSDEVMRELNQTYLGKNSTTDVLAFNQDYFDPENGRLYLGDIIISVDQAHAQALENEHSLNEECALLAIHGILHLLGYDHSEAKEKDRMWQLQESILQKLMESNQEDAE